MQIDLIAVSSSAEVVGNQDFQFAVKRGVVYGRNLQYQEAKYKKKKRTRGHYEQEVS